MDESVFMVTPKPVPDGIIMRGLSLDAFLRQLGGNGDIIYNPPTLPEIKSSEPFQRTFYDDNIDILMRKKC